MNALPTIAAVGNLVADPEFKLLPSGVATARFRIACTQRVKGDDGTWTDGEPTFLTCNAWRQLAENLTESLHKGQRVIVTGRLKQRSYETKDGDKRTVFEVEVDEVGPSLRWGTTTANKVATRSDAPAAPGGQQGNDPWGQSGQGSSPPF